MYLITKEAKDGLVEGVIFAGQNVIRIYKLLGEADRKRFCNGVICDDIGTVFEVVDRILKKEKKKRTLYRR